MDLTQDQIIDILKLIDESPMGRFSLQVGDLKLDVVKGTGGAPEHSSEPGPRISQDVKSGVAAPATTAPATTAAVAEPERSALSADTLTDAGLVAIKAPILGIFYRRPDPGSPPYVEEGSVVDEATIVALIEGRKLFNPVKAGVRGRIHKACVANGQLVEYEQPLFLVLPA